MNFTALPPDSMRIVYVIPALLFMAGCYDTKEQPASQKTKSSFVFKETIATGSDSGMRSLTAFRKRAIADALCQHWEGGYASEVGEMALFKDSSVLVNPRGKARIGGWQVQLRDGAQILLLHFPDHRNTELRLIDVKPRYLRAGAKGVMDSVERKFEGEGVIHQNMYNDPWHPVNNAWRIAPNKRESDSAIYQRARDCVKFYALFFRDNIRRKKDVINFEGLPAIFRWYSGGIGLPDRDELRESFVDCFYDKQDALKAYQILRKLIVAYEFNWPEGAPNWVYQTHSVLEQMYHKMGERSK